MPQEKGKKLLVIDGNAIVHRAYHALPPMQIKTGEELGITWFDMIIKF